MNSTAHIPLEHPEYILPAIVISTIVIVTVIISLICRIFCWESCKIKKLKAELETEQRRNELMERYLKENKIDAPILHLPEQQSNVSQRDRNTFEGAWRNARKQIHEPGASPAKHIPGVPHDEDIPGAPSSKWKNAASAPLKRPYQEPGQPGYESKSMQDNLLGQDTMKEMDALPDLPDIDYDEDSSRSML